MAFRSAGRSGINLSAMSAVNLNLLKKAVEKPLLIGKSSIQKLRSGIPVFLETKIYLSCHKYMKWSVLPKKGVQYLYSNMTTT